MAVNREVMSPTADREIRLTRVFRAPRHLVYTVWTQPEHVAAWWGPRGFRTTNYHMDVRPGGELRYDMHGPDGVDYPNLIIFEQVVPGERLVYRHGGLEETADVTFHVTVTFEDEGPGQTRVTMVSVFPTAAERNHVVEKYGALEGGIQHLERLGEHVTQMADDTFVIERSFNAPRDMVFRAWTDPDRIARWFGPKGFRLTLKSADIRPGGTMHARMEGPNGLEVWSTWEVREIIPTERFVFMSCFSNEEGGLGRHPVAPEWPQQHLCTVSFEDNAGGTKVMIRYTPMHETAAERSVFAANHESMRGGWGGTLDQLGDYLSSASSR